MPKYTSVILWLKAVIYEETTKEGNKVRRESNKTCRILHTLSDLEGV